MIQSEDYLRSRSFLPLRPRYVSKLLSAVVAGLCLISGVSGTRAEEIDFNRDIRPILSDKCFYCHGPDSNHREADLRLDVRDAAVDSGVLLPGDTENSELLRRIKTTDADELMPPPASKRTLSAAQKELIQKWIEQGAEYQAHWAFEPIHPVAPPEVANDNWSRSELDRFLLKKMQQKGLEPNPPAEPALLLKRVTYDLIGLPPTVEELDAFLANPSEEAYEKAVDRLLESTAYGERMAADWLDVARYSDTYGYQVDRDRYVWPWRDWVIRAFNRNLPYDQFLTEQLAGDLIPNATDEQILATTFNRLHPQKVEGGSTPEEFRIEYVADRTQTFATAFLGLTMECARCHSHKYDPITQTEYYQLSSFFDNIDEFGLYSYFTPSIPTPTLLLSNDQQKSKLSQLHETVAASEHALANHQAQLQEGFKQWMASIDATQPASLLFPPQKEEGEDKPEQEAAPKPVPTLPGQVAHLDFEAKPGGKNQSVAGVNGQAIQLTGDDAVPLKVGNFQRFQPFSISFWMQTPDVKDRAVIFHRSRAWTDAGSRGYELLIEEGKLSAALIHFWPGNAIRIETADPIPTQTWLHVTMTYDGSSKADGLQLWINGARSQTTVVRDNLTKQITGGGQDNIHIGERFRDRGFTNGLVDEFRVFDCELASPEIQFLAHEFQPESQLTLTKADWQDFYSKRIDASANELRQQLLTARKELCAALDPIPEIMVMRELPEPRPTYRLVRGVYDAPAEEVATDVPSIFPPLPDDAPQNRLALAEWLTSDEHPLTARVAVNRYWQMIFEQGLVRTPEDFGSQGTPPSHPQLLDWLADDFRSHGWDVKRLLKQIVMSAVYRQSSNVTSKSLQIDPTNQWLSRYPAHRLTAEMLRDMTLATSGLLVNKIGGAPVHPYELEDSFKPTKRSKGEGLYRRSLYTYWKRTGPAPAMMTFDAAKRDVCQVKREKTSSPLQAFVQLNGPQVVEAARELAYQNWKRAPDDPNAQIQRMFRQLTARTPEQPELDVLLQLYTDNRERFQQHPEKAHAYLDVGDHPIPEDIAEPELAALSLVANTLFNFDEAMLLR